MSEADAPRQPHAALEPAGRRSKAAKILRLLALPPYSGVRRLLEVGTGSGVIAHFFAALDTPRFEVDAVDVVDLRRVDGGYRFQRVEGTALPFGEASFDVVLSNHVIEHVGGRDAQAHHLAEIARVLRPGGVAYVATPNRWQVVEPHFKLAFLSWLPRGWRDAYVRLAQRGARYDCDPLALGELERLLARAGLQGENLLQPALQAMVELEPRRARVARVAAALPARWLHALRPLSPTHLFLLRHAAPPGSPAR